MHHSNKHVGIGDPMSPSKTLCGLNRTELSEPDQILSGTHWVYGEINCSECRGRLLEGIEQLPENLI